MHAQAALESFQFQTAKYWIWIGIAFLLGTIALLITGATLGLTWISPAHARPSVAVVNNTIAAKRATRDHDKMRVQMEKRESDAYLSCCNGVMYYLHSCNARHGQKCNSVICLQLLLAPHGLLR